MLTPAAQTVAQTSGPIDSVRTTPGRWSSPRRGGNIILGCLAVVGAFTVIGLVLIGAALLFGPGLVREAVATEFRDLGASAIDEAAVPESEKPDMIEHVNRVADGMEDGTINFILFGALSEDVVLESQLLWVGTVFLIDEKYVQTSGLSDEERADGHQQLVRFAHGLRDWYLGRTDLLDAASAVLDNTGYSDSPKLKSRADVSDDDLREIIANMKEACDEDDLAPDLEVFDLSDAFGEELDTFFGLNTGYVSGPDEPATDEVVGEPAGP
ncbi:MAG: hypothetical protein AAGI53_03925 [Planctomycetota bacterium]